MSQLTRTRRRGPALADPTPDRLPPHDTEAEAGALACVLSATNGEAETMLGELELVDLYDDRHREIFSALQCLRLEKKSLDVLSARQWIKEHNRRLEPEALEAFLAYIAGLPDATPSPANFPCFLETVKDRAMRRRKLAEATKLQAEALDLTKPFEAAPVIADAVPIGELHRQDPGDPGELILSRFLCRLCALLLCGPTGIGKSSLLIQLLLLFGIGRPAFGLRPSRPLTSLLIQAENDDGDIAEMRDGILRGLDLTESERARAVSAVHVHREDTHTGLEFCRSVVRTLLRKHKPDILAIDPALAYIGGQSKEQGDVTPFLRNGLNPLLREFNCGLIIAHHTNKPPTGREKSNWQAGDFAYLGAGSAEWANWPRAILALRSVGSHEVFELLAPKRGGRIGWKDSEGNPAYQKFLAHSKEPGVICWQEVGADEVPTKGRPKSYDVAEMLALLPPEGLPAGEWQRLAKSDAGISEASFHRERRALEKAGRVIRSKVSGKWQPIKSA